MSNKKIIFISLILGLASALMVFLYVTNLNKATTNIDYKKIVVAKQDIPSKSVITKDMLELKEIPKDYVNNSAYTNYSEVVGKIAKYEIVSGEQVLKAKIAGEKDVNEGMAYTVEKGKRAITVSVNQVTGINGFIKTGDHVDLAATMDVELRGQQQTSKVTVNKIIVQDVVVMAIDNVVDSNAKTDKKDTTAELKTITLLVPVNDTRGIMLANDKGTLHLLLRSPSDSEKATSEPFTAEKLLNP